MFYWCRKLYLFWTFVGWNFSNYHATDHDQWLKLILLMSILLITVVGIFQIVNNRGLVTQLFSVKLETYVKSLQRMSLNES